MLKYFEPIRLTMTFKLISPAYFYFWMWLLGPGEWHLWLPLYFGENWSATARVDGRGMRVAAGRTTRLLGKSPDETGLNYLNPTQLQNRIHDFILPPKAFPVITIPNESPFSQLLGHFSSVVSLQHVITYHLSFLRKFCDQLFLRSDCQLLGLGIFNFSRHL